MRQVSLALLLVTTLTCPGLHAQPETTTRDLQAEVDALQQRLAESEAAYGALLSQTQSAADNGLGAQMQRLRQENQRLKLQLKAAQAGGPQPWLNEKQTWLAIGGALALLGVLFGALLRGGRRNQRQWIN